MRVQFLLFFIGICSISKAQNIEEYNSQLIAAYEKINYWSELKNKHIDNYDSLELYNNRFEELLLKVTSSDESSLQYGFAELLSKGLEIVSSEDKMFRIYTWDTKTGGTMKYFRNIFQYKNNSGLYSKLNRSTEEEPENGYRFLELSKIMKSETQQYITISVSIASSNLFYYNLKFYYIDENQLNGDIKLLKTKNGMMNEMGYEVDLNKIKSKKLELSNCEIKYDRKNQTITLSMVDEHGNVINKRLQYKFNGSIFELIK